MTFLRLLLHLYSCHFTPRRFNIVVVDQPKHRNIPGKMLLGERCIAIRQNNDTSRKLVFHMLVNIFEDNLKIRSTATGRLDFEYIIYTFKGLWLNNGRVKETKPAFQLAVKLVDGAFYFVSCLSTATRWCTVWKRSRS